MLIVACTLVACATDKVEFVAGEARALSARERALVERLARTSIEEVRVLLPDLPRSVTLRVEPSHGVIPETGESGTTMQPSTLIWYVDPARGVEDIARAWLRACIFHEAHHLVRDARVRRSTMLDRAITEGMGTAFERDFAGVDPPWSHAPAEVGAWLDEIRALPKETLPPPWITRHPDGRRWVALRTGTYVVDRAVRASGKSAAALVHASTQEVLRLAGLADGER